MDDLNNISPCHLVTHADGRFSLLLRADLAGHEDIFEALRREPNGHCWSQVIQTVIAPEIQSTLLFDPEADMVSIVGRDKDVLLQIAQQIRHLLDDEGALRAAIEKAEWD